MTGYVQSALWVAVRRAPHASFSKWAVTYEIYSDCIVERLRERVIWVAEQHTRLPDTWVSNNEEFEKLLTGWGGKYLDEVLIIEATKLTKIFNLYKEGSLQALQPSQIAFGVDILIWEYQINKWNLFKVYY